MKNRVFWIDPRRDKQGASPVVNVGEVIVIDERGILVEQSGIRFMVPGGSCHTTPKAPSKPSSPSIIPTRKGTRP